MEQEGPAVKPLVHPDKAEAFWGVEPFEQEFAGSGGGVTTGGMVGAKEWPPRVTSWSLINTGFS